MAWSEKEIRAAIVGYFELLAAEEAGEYRSKAALYRSLAENHPRSAKAFERKFQNISAVLYEQRLPFCTGIKPSRNYQRILKLLVLDHLDRTQQAAVEPHEILLSRLRKIRERGAIPVKGRGAGRFGLAVEEALGIPPNSSKAADFMGIELKTKRDGSLQTLFSRTPTRYVSEVGRVEFFEQHHYWDESRGRRALYTSFTSSPDSLGFRLRPQQESIQVIRNGQSVLEYDNEVLEAALLSKHMQTAFIALIPSRDDSGEYCEIDSALYCKWPSIIRFVRLVKDGQVFLDFTMSERPDGRLRDHGFLWRIRSEALDRMYLSSEALDV